MNARKYISDLLDTVTEYTKDLDAAQLARFNELFDPLTSKGARYVNRQWDGMISNQLRLPRKIRRIQQLDARRAVKKERNTRTASARKTLAQMPPIHAAESPSL